MADLEDFFAKKDKKKKGKKAKKFVGTNPVSISKELEVATPPPSAESEKPKKDTMIDLSSSNAGDDEWREVEENEEKDLEGLKIRSLRADGAGIEAVEKKEEDGTDVHVDAEMNTDPGSGGSAWQSLQAKNTSEQEVEEEAEPKEKTPPPSPTPAKPAAYVPPSLRNHARGASNFGGPGRMPGRGGRRPDAPPDILSSEAFPTLGAN